jgi:hypothetical protein
MVEISAQSSTSIPPPGRMQNQVRAHHAGDRARSAETRNLRRHVRQHVGERRQQTAQQVKDRVPQPSHVVFDVVAKNPEEPHIPEEVRDAAVHEHSRQQRQIDGDRRALEAELNPFDRLAIDAGPAHDFVLRDQILPRRDLRRHGRIGHRERFVGPHPLKHDKHEDVHRDQRHGDDGKAPPIAIVVAEGEDHELAPRR